jgi:segregation and condensation protein B
LFGLNTLRELPTLKEFAELTPESRDMYERRIGEPVPDRGMNLETHYEAPSHGSDGDETTSPDLDEEESLSSDDPSEVPAESGGDSAPDDESSKANHLDRA